MMRLLAMVLVLLAGVAVAAEQPTVALDINSSHPLSSNCFGERSAGVVIDTVVVHFTSAIEVTPDDPYNLKTNLDIFEKYKVGSHYIIDRTGKLFLIISEEKRAFHAGLSQLADGRTGLNDFSIGIEVMGVAGGKYEPAQVASLEALVRDLKKRHPAIVSKNLVGHDEIRSLWNANHPERQGAKKVDPGTNLDMNAFRAKFDKEWNEAAAATPGAQTPK